MDSILETTWVQREYCDDLSYNCGYELHPVPDDCPLCNGQWQGWELLFAPHALDDLRAQVMGWIGQLPFPAVVEWIASPKGIARAFVSSSPCAPKELCKPGLP